MSLVIVTANGNPWTGWERVTIHQSHDKCVGEAHVTCSELPGNPLPIRMGDFCTVTIDGRPVITGYCHEVHGSLDPHRHDINVVIRDQTQDLVDSTVGPKLKVQPPITLHQLSQQTIKAMGLPIPVIDNIGPPPFEKGEVPSAAIDMPGFGFLDDWARKRQVLFNTDGKGSLVIDRNRQLIAPARLQSTFEDDPYNNVERSSYRVSDLKRHNSTSVNGQKSTADKKHYESLSKSDAQSQALPTQKNWGTAFDRYVRPLRKRHLRGVRGLAGTSPKLAAQWQANIDKARGFEYTATVSGFYGAPGWLWWHGFLVPVLDTHWELAAMLLIKDVKFMKDMHKGETTEVTCTYPEAFTTQEGAGASGRTSSRGLGGSSVGGEGDPGI